MSHLVYRYGLLAPVEGADLVQEQLRLKHEYYNKLLEIVREKRKSIRAAMESAGEKIPALQAAVELASKEVEEAVSVISKARKLTRSRSETESMRQNVALARQKLGAAKRALIAERKRIRSEGLVRTVTDSLSEDFLAQRRNLRKEYSARGLRHGTYTLVEDAVSKSDSDTPLYDGAMAQDPKFLRWTGDGSIGVQIVGGMTVDDLTSHTFLRIEPVSEMAWQGSRGERRRLGRTRLWMRVGSKEDRSPIWAVWPMQMHRPLPVGSKIKTAAVHLKRIGPREEWFVTLTIDTSDCITPSVVNNVAVAVDTGWRVIGDEIRVAVWRAQDGSTGELRLSQTHGPLGGLSRIREIQGTRSMAFDSIRTNLVKWLSEQTVPEWFCNDTKSLALWKSPRRLVTLLNRWSEARFDGDKDIFEQVSAWRYHDYHLWCWEAEGRKNALDARKHAYHTFAANLARRFGVLVLENNAGLKRIAMRPETEVSAGNEVARSNRHFMATSELREALIQGFVSRGGRVWGVPAENSTKTCAECGLIESWDAAAMVSHKCSGCGALWDQDENAALVLLTRWIERPSTAKLMGSVRYVENDTSEEVQESRRERVVRLLADKRKRMQHTEIVVQSAVDSST